jgi:hypothetical protein
LRWDVFRENAVDPGWYRDPAKQWGIAAIFALTSAVTLAPLFFSQKKLKRLEILTNS